MNDFSNKVHEKVYANLTVSLFCDQIKWNDVLKNLIIPYLNHIPAGAKPIYWKLILSNTAEEIILSLFVEKSVSPNLKSYYDDYLSEILIQNELGEYLTKGFSTGFSLNRERFFVCKEDLGAYHFENKLSELIIDHLSIDIIDDESIITFAFLLSTSLILFFQIMAWAIKIY